MDLHEMLLSYWTITHLEANFIIMLNLLGALLLGFFVGYERTYHGRAAGMRTYGLVCMASAGVVLVSGYPELWFGGQAPPIEWHTDPTRSIQGIVTGIGFLGAGVIMKDGFSISGLTTAASLWTASAIGIMVGMGLYPSAIFLAICAVSCMTIVSKFEAKLPSEPAIAVMLRFKKGFEPDATLVGKAILEYGFQMASGSISINHANNQTEWHFVVLTLNKRTGVILPSLAKALLTFDGVEDVNLAHARN